MTREGIIDFIQQTQHLMQQLAQVQKNINEGKALKELFDVEGDVERSLQIAKQISDMQKTYDKIAPAVLRKCKRDSVGASETLVADIVERLKLADDAHELWRASLAQHDIECQLTPEDTEGRRVREERLADYQRRYEVSLTAAGDMVPSPGVVLLG